MSSELKQRMEKAYRILLYVSSKGSGRDKSAAASRRSFGSMRTSSFEILEYLEIADPYSVNVGLIFRQFHYKRQPTYPSNVSSSSNVLHDLSVVNFTLGLLPEPCLVIKIKLL